MLRKFIKHWFSALPFTVALRTVVLFLVKKVIGIPVNFHYSLTGEDVILSTLLPRDNGFYIDVGCNEPIEISNTYNFYLRGWRGITIDANEDLIKKHRKVRKLDLSLCAAVSDSIKKVTFYKSEINAVSTIAEDFYEDNKGQWQYNERQTVTTRTLTSILDEHLPQGKTIDLLTVDVEGIDLEVLQGLDFNKYRPRVIIVEAHDFSIEDKESHPIYQHLLAHDYRLKAFATMNLYFVDSDRI